MTESVVHVCVADDAETRARIDRVSAVDGRRLVHVEKTQLADVLPEIEILIGSVMPGVDWSRGSKLRLVQYLSSGIDGSLPMRGLREGVVVANARGLHVSPMRDHALAMMLGFERKLPEFAALQRDSKWRPSVAGTVVEKTVMVLGLGAVGSAIAEACSALGMRVIGSRFSPKPTAHVEVVFALDALAEHMPNADHVVVALPLTSKTRNVIDAHVIAKMKRTAVLIHLSRGGIVDETAIANALRNGRIRGAALDAFETEPLPASSPLWSVPNLVITPHVSGVLDRHLELAMELALDNVSRIERGAPPRTPVDLSRGY